MHTSKWLGQKESHIYSLYTAPQSTDGLRFVFWLAVTVAAIAAAWGVL